MKRLPSWPALLDRYLKLKRDDRFEWGRCDCATFACGAVEAMTCVDLAEEFRGTYRTELGAARVMRRFAGGGVRELAEKIAAKWNIQQLESVRLARRGDVVLLPHEHGEALGIVSLDSRWIFWPGANGSMIAPLYKALVAWRI